MLHSFATYDIIPRDDDVFNYYLCLFIRFMSVWRMTGDEIDSHGQHVYRIHSSTIHMYGYVL